METGKPGLASAPMHISSVSAQAENRMDTKASLTAVYIHTLPALQAQTYPEPPTAPCEPAMLHLAVAPLISKEILPFLTLNIGGGLQSQLGIGTAAVVAPATRLKSAGKHVCQHCGRDCMKPSVLEKHLRCHTGERPYPCTTCGVSFKTQSNLYKHRRTQAHARLSSESEHSSLGSLDSSRETCTPNLSLDERSQESGRMEKASLPPAAEGTSSLPHLISVKTQSSLSELKQSNVTGHHRELNASQDTTSEDNKQKLDEGEPPFSANQHLPLQRQEAMLFSKQWERSLSQGKSQNHESTDSGFSESSDHYPSPASVLPEHSMDSLSESTKEAIQTTTGTHVSVETRQCGQEPDGAVREQEKKSLEERISKLISDNTAVVEDKQLENVRPRKTVLSKQGSIDLPMPYTYKDSFHFEMRNSQGFSMQANRKPGLFSSVASQRSSTIERAPMMRSNSLPFSVTLLQPEKNSPTPYHHSDYVTLVRRGSSGQINPTSFTIRPVTQHASTHRILVRQAAVDCNSAADGLFVSSSVEEACTGSLSCDGDICGEPSNRKFQRKKAQKFAYNKWYMYGGGTFKKLYNPERGCDNNAIRGRKCATQQEHKVGQGLKRLQSVKKGKETVSGSMIGSSAAWCPPDSSPASLPNVAAVDVNQQACSVKAPLRRNLSQSVLPLPSIGSLVRQKTNCVNRTEAGRLNHEGKHSDSTLQLCGAQFPSNRKKQRTECNTTADMETNPSTLTYSPPSVTYNSPQHETTVTYINLNKTPTHAQLEGVLFSPCKINANAPCVSAVPAASILSPTKKSFLPKYQLKIPNTVETVSDSSLELVDKLTDTFSSTLLPAQNEQPSPSVTTGSQNHRGSAACPVMQTFDVTHKMVGPTKGQVMLPRIFTAVCQSLAPCLTAIQRQTASATLTTSCRQDHQAGLCSTLIQSSKSAIQSMQIPQTVAHAALPATLTLTTANKPTSPAAVASFSHLTYLNPTHPLSEALTTSDMSNSGKRQLTGPDAPVVPCHVVPPDLSQPAAQNIFHVNTADLQICFQIISDEQLALIEPQIERPSSFGLSQVPSGCVQEKVQSFAAKDSNNGDKGQKSSDKESLQGASLTGCVVPEELQSQEQKGPQWQLDGCRPKQIKAAGETSQPHLDKDKQDGVFGRGAVTEGNENGGIRADESSGHWDMAEPSRRYTIPSHVTKPEGEDKEVTLDAALIPRLSEQPPLHLSQMHSGTLQSSPKSPQSAPNVFSLPKPPLERDHPGVSLQTQVKSIIHDQETHASFEPNSRLTTDAQVYLSVEQNVLSGLRLRHAASCQESEAASRTQPSHGNTMVGDTCTGVSCCDELQSRSHNNTSLIPDVGVSSFMCSGHTSRDSAVPSGLPGDNQTMKDDQTVVPLPKTSTLREKDNKHETLNKDTHAYSTQSLLLAGALYGYQPMEGLRPVQSCQGYAEDTSSSDEEGKLIIEL